MHLINWMLAVAKAESQAGAVVFVAPFELTAKAVFSMVWLQWLQAPVMLTVVVRSFLFFPYRETPEVPLAQICSSRNSRLFSGVPGFLVGVLNFGINVKL